MYSYIMAAIYTNGTRLDLSDSFRSSTVTSPQLSQLNLMHSVRLFSGKQVRSLNRV